MVHGVENVRPPTAGGKERYKFLKIRNGVLTPYMTANSQPKKEKSQNAE
jgi:hypothetical protein